ncbi:hypothetical protein F5Y15DRAFT_387035 [Xylariaceae sp. FL0016]|nr:hypothetical protein F5Y15DRAFT_387035 [Xylariaceae sp. FL0016]
MADKYIIRVTAGSDYDVDHHTIVPVNAPETISISSDLMDVELNVRVRNYNGLPRGSPSSSPYFELEPHAANHDQYSIAMRFTPKKPTRGRRSKSKTASGTSLNNGEGSRGASRDPEEDVAAVNPGSRIDNEDKGTSEVKGISGHDLQFGNDFDHPIRDRLPPGFSYAMSIVKWWIDPGLDGDPYADMPYLYGPGLSSFNAIHNGPGEYDAKKGGLHFEEGGDEAGLAARRATGAPDDAKGRKKWALGKAAKDGWEYEYGHTYCVDFFNPYLDFSDFALKLPGFTLPIMKYWDGQSLRAKPKRSHTLRYVLRNRSTGDTYLVILFTLYLKEDVNEDGSLKPAALQATREDKAMAVESGKLGADAKDEQGAEQSLEEARKHFERLEVEKTGDTRRGRDNDVD